MSGFWDRVRSQPALLTGAIRAVIAVAIVFQWVQWSDQQIGTVILAVEAVLTIFTFTTVAPTVKLEKAGIESHDYNKDGDKK